MTPEWAAMKFNGSEPRRQYVLDHRNGRGTVEYFRFDRSAQMWIVGGWHPTRQREQAIKAIKHAIRMTDDHDKATGQEFLAAFEQWTAPDSRWSKDA